MPDSRELQIVLKMKDELGGKLDALQKNLDKTNKEVSKSEGAFNQFAGAVAAAVSVGAIIEFARRSVQAASEAQTAFTKLAHILNTSTGATEAQVMMLADQAQALERVGVVTGDVVMAAQAQLATFDLQAESIQKLIPSFLDMVVAEKGVNATTDDMIGYANALGMALDGNYGALTKRGFKLDEATQQMIEHGTETERIDAITQVLNSTYEGLNEQMSQTFEGRMKRAQTIVGNLQQDIGFALIPTIEALIGDFIGLTDSLAGNQARVDAWAKGIYRATNFLIGMAKGVKLVGEILAFLGDSLVSLVRIWGTGVGEMFYAFTQLGSHVKTIATAIAKAFTGDFQGAADTLKSAVKEAFSYTIGEMDRMAFNTAGWAEQIKATWQDIGDSANKSINLEGFKPVSVASAAAYRNMSQGAKDTAREVEGLAKEVKSMDEAYQKLQEKSADALFDMEQDHAKSLESIRGEIKKTEAAMNDLYFSFARERQSDTERVAGEVIKTQDRVNEIQKELQGELSQARRKELEDELAKNQASLSANAEFIKSIDGAVVEARRRAGLTDLQRAIEDFNERRALAENEFNYKMQQLQQELTALHEKETREKQLHQEKQDFINTLMAEAAKRHEENLKNQLQMTKESIEAEIELYERLARAIAQVRGANTTEFNRVAGQIRPVNDAIISPKGDIITTHPDDYLIATKNPGALGGGVVVNVYGDVSGNELVAKVQEGIMNTLRLNSRLPV